VAQGPRANDTDETAHEKSLDSISEMYAAGRRRRRTRRATVWNTQNSRQRQQSRQRYAAGGFAFVPHSCRFLGRQSLGVEPAVKGSSLHLVPILPFRERGTHGPTAKIAGRTTAFLRLPAPAAIAVEKGRPRREWMSGPSFTQRAILGTCGNHTARCRRK
jgi:hypothetical protein